jgi:phospholipase C
MSEMSDMSLARLAAVKHIVVLMMENRSFDHMLGYLMRDGMPDVNGLTGDEVNLDATGNPYPVFEFPAGETAFHKPGEPFDQSLDPCHGSGCVREQISDSNGGFVRNFIAEKNPPPEWRGLPMGHYTAEHLPVYDHLARNYCVCDAWHSSIPGDTWPNRLFAMAAREGPKVEAEKLHFLQHLVGSSLWNTIKNAPIYDQQAFTRQLADAQWRWYAHDPATLRCADPHYRNFAEPKRENFGYVDRRTLSALTDLLEVPIIGHDSFLDDAAKGQLREVSWIDPNFIDLHTLHTTSNDDHPPGDVLAGQALVLDLYEALVNSPGWADTVFVIVYDEHGGFYDHVAPPPVADGSGYPTYGLRVPAIVVGPRVRQGVSHQLFDHTALMKTILLRFASDPQAAIAKMGPRVQNSAHLGVLLEDEPRLPTPDRGDLHARLDDWRSLARAQRRGQPATVSTAPDGAGHPLVLNEFQADFARFALAMRHAGLPNGQP